MKRALFLGLWLLGCRPATPPLRMPSPSEVGPESVVVNYGPQKLRVFPAPAPTPGSPSPSYLILGSERPELTAAFRPLGGTAQKPPPGFIARAGSLVYIASHVVEAAPPPPGASAPRFIVYDNDGKVGTPVDVKLQAPCAPAAAALIQADATRIYAAVKCATPDVVLLLTLDDKAQLIAVNPAVGASRAERFLHQPDADYLLSGRQVLRLVPGSHDRPAIGAVPTPLDDGPLPARDLLRSGDLVLVVDGRAGRVTALYASDMAWRFEKRFAVDKDVRAVQAAIGAPGRLYIVTTEQTPQGATLFGTVLTLTPTGDDSPPRLFLGTVQSPGALIPPELVPIAEADGGGALLISLHAGNSGPLVALRKLTL